MAGSLMAGSQQTYSPSWFQITAQVIPVLLLALAVEVRAFEFSPELRSRIRFNPTSDLEAIKRRLENPRVGEFVTRLMLAPVLIILAAGEILALNVIGKGEAGSRLEQTVISGAIVAGLVMIGIVAVIGSSKAKG